MDEGTLRKIASEYLLPFFSGAEIEEHTFKSSRIHATVALRSRQSIFFKVRKSDPYRLAIFRTQPFTSSLYRVVNEQRVIQSFVDVLSDIDKVVPAHLRTDFLAAFQRRVVARAISGPANENTVLSCIDQMTKWSDRLYEGTPISAAIGLRQTGSRGDISLEDFCGLEMSAVLSNGLDTLLSFNFDKRLVGFEPLPRPEILPSFCPVRQAQIADWTKKEGSRKKGSRVAFSLNRLGEILIFRRAELVFARRSSQWHFLTHEPVIAQMGVPHDKALRTAIYETCLDASFARTGACIGVASMEQEDGWKSLVVQRDDYLAASDSAKGRSIRTVTRGRNFKDLDRRARQELAAIDGAVVLSHRGEIHAVGAILKIPGGSTGGGRLAAARSLARLGLGIKVSQDGSITGFRGQSSKAVFKVM